MARKCPKCKEENHFSKNQYYCKECCKKSKARRRYEITSEEYDELMGIESCAICKRNFEEHCLIKHIDHEHHTMVIRGVLCGNCNRGLGRFKDNSDYLSSAADYIRNGKRTLERQLKESKDNQSS